MVAALHAQRILEAWDVTAPHERDNGRFAVELKSALSSCRETVPATSLESEQQAVLESVVSQLSKLPSIHQTEAGLSLLRHLRGRVN